MHEITKNSCFAFAVFVACTSLAVEAKNSDSCKAQMIKATYGTVGGCCDRNQFYDVYQMTCRKCPYAYTNCVKNTRSRCLYYVPLKPCPPKATSGYSHENMHTPTVDNHLTEQVKVDLDPKTKPKIDSSWPLEVASDAEIKNTSPPTNFPPKRNEEKRPTEKKSPKSDENISGQHKTLPAEKNNTDQGSNVKNNPKKRKDTTLLERFVAHWPSFTFGLTALIFLISFLVCVYMQTVTSETIRKFSAIVASEQLS